MTHPGGASQCLSFWYGQFFLECCFVYLYFFFCLYVFLSQGSSMGSTCTTKGQVVCAIFFCISFTTGQVPGGGHGMLASPRSQAVLEGNIACGQLQ